MASTFAVLRGLHILFAVLWAGSILFKVSVLRSAARRDDRFVTAYLAAGTGATLQIVVASGAVVSGFLAFISGGGPSGFPRLVFIVAVLAALAALLLTLVWQLPLERKARPLAAATLSGSEDADLDDLRARAVRLDRVSTVLVTVTLLGMVGFRLV